jgi:hypothetical protein
MKYLKRDIISYKERTEENHCLFYLTKMKIIVLINKNSPKIYILEQQEKCTT